MIHIPDPPQGSTSVKLVKGGMGQFKIAGLPSMHSCLLLDNYIC